MSRGFFIVFEVSTPFQWKPKLRKQWPVHARLMWLWFAVMLVPEPWALWLHEFTATAREMEREGAFATSPSATSVAKHES